MKMISITKLARLSGMIAALALFTAGGHSTVAGEIFTGKGAAKLLMKSQTQTSAPAQRTMACAKCQDGYIQRTDLSTRGALKSKTTVVRHLCGGCETTIITAGQGKAKQDVAVHQCASCGASNPDCCSVRQVRDGKGTLGME